VTRKTLLIAAAGLLAVGVALGCWLPFRHGPQVLRLPGVVEIQEVRLGSKVGGRVAQVNTTEGDLVEAGQELVVFEAPELEAQREQWQARYLAARAEYEKAKNGSRAEEIKAAAEAVKAAKARWERLKAGWREEEKRQAQAEQELADADLKVARADFERVEKLFRQGSLSRTDYDAAWARMRMAQGRADNARARNDMLRTGSRPEDIAEAAAEMGRAQANLDLLLAGTRSEDIAAAEARMKEAHGRLREVEANLAEAVVRAPERAVVEVLAVRKGDLVPPNQPVVRVLRATDLWVKVYVPETELGKVRLGQAVEVTIDSYPSRRFAGTVMQIASESEFTPRNVQSVDERRHQVFGIKVRVSDPEGVFKSGMAAAVYMPLAE
jgi:multidrug resistance efflux pump